MTPIPETVPHTPPMPVLFIGHGSPANALRDNPFTRALAALRTDMPRPSAVLVVSAHWLTRGPRVLCTAQPRTLHDFYGFEPGLYAVQYPASGALGIARAVAALVGVPCESAWGLDHASWAVLRHIFPDADVPVFEISIDVTSRPASHVEFARLLAPLRERGVLIVGSGNLVHNLGAIRWKDDALPYDWAIEFDAWARDRLVAGDLDALIRYQELGEVAELAVPTDEHYVPLLYAAALRREGEPLSFIHEGIELGSVSMRSVRFG
jgi:4,5-DOPA dioxygenase extradiol